jgi:hypothetical protein
MNDNLGAHLSFLRKQESILTEMDSHFHGNDSASGNDKPKQE